MSGGGLFLHETPLSPYVEKVKIALREKGLAFESRVPEGIGVGVSAPLLRANPRSEAPALEHGDVVVFDSTIILEYLEDCFPDPPLRPPDAASRARARMIEEVCDTHYEAINWGLYEITYFGRGADGLADTLRDSARRDLACVHGWLERQLGTTPWFGGDAFGWADLAVAPFVAGSSFLGFPLDAKRPLASWFAAASARPTVAETFAESRASVHMLTGAASALRSGLLRRHYRDHRLEWIIRAGGLPVVTEGLAAGDVRFTELAQLIG